MLGFLLLSFTAVFASGISTESSGTVRAIDPPSFLMDTNLSFLNKIMLAVVFALIIFITIIPKPDYKKYQMAILNALGLTIGINELICFGLLPTTFLALFVVAGVCLSLYDPTTSLVQSLGCGYPAGILILAVLGLQNYFIGMLIIVMLTVIAYFVLSTMGPIFDFACKVAGHTFLTCCILGLTVFDLLKSGLSTQVGTWGIMEIIARFLIFLIVLFFIFLPMVLSLLERLIFKEEKQENPSAETDEKV